MVRVRVRVQRGVPVRQMGARFFSMQTGQRRGHGLPDRCGLAGVGDAAARPTEEVSYRPWAGRWGGRGSVVGGGTAARDEAGAAVTKPLSDMVVVGSL